jgi:hypothetical protein
MPLWEIVQVNRVSLTFRRHLVMVIFVRWYRSVNTPLVSHRGTEVTARTETTLSLRGSDLVQRSDLPAGVGSFVHLLIGHVCLACPFSSLSYLKQSPKFNQDCEASPSFNVPSDFQITWLQRGAVAIVYAPRCRLSR